MRNRACAVPRGSTTAADATCQSCSPKPMPRGIVSTTAPARSSTSTATLPWYELSGECRRAFQAYCICHVPGLAAKAPLAAQVSFCNASSVRLQQQGLARGAVGLDRVAGAVDPNVAGRLPALGQRRLGVEAFGEGRRLDAGLDDDVGPHVGDVQLGLLSRVRLGVEHQLDQLDRVVPLAVVRAAPVLAAGDRRSARSSTSCHWPSAVKGMSFALVALAGAVDQPEAEPTGRFGSHLQAEAFMAWTFSRANDFRTPT